MTTANFDENDPESMRREIDRLQAKIQRMRSILWEWNSSSGPVWEHYRLKEVGETQEDYAFIDENYEPDMPLFDDHDNHFED